MTLVKRVQRPGRPEGSGLRARASSRELRRHGDWPPACPRVRRARPAGTRWQAGGQSPRRAPRRSL